METQWFYLEGDERRGPVSVEELIRAISGAARPHRVHVWRQGLADWHAAGSMPEIRDRLPPPQLPTRSGPDASRSLPLADAEAIAKLYRRLVLLVGLQLLLGLLQVPLEQAAPSALLLPFLISLALIGTLVTISVTTYKLTRYLGESLPILWAVAMFIPCANIFGLLVISSKAQTWCKQYGIKVGLLGPTKKSIEEVRRRTLTAEFE